MSDTPIADELADQLGAGWVVHQWPDHQDGHVNRGINEILYEQTTEECAVPTERQLQQMQDLVNHRVAEGDIDGAADLAKILDGAKEGTPPPEPTQ